MPYIKSLCCGHQFVMAWKSIRHAVISSRYAVDINSSWRGNQSVMARLVRAIWRGTVLDQMARTSRAVTECPAPQRFSDIACYRPSPTLRNNLSQYALITTQIRPCAAKGAGPSATGATFATESGAAARGACSLD